MDFITNREALLAELNIFSGVVDIRPTDPMSEFANVTFRPEGDGCELVAASGEIGLRSAISAQVKGEGPLNAPVGLLAAWLKEGRGEVVAFSHSEDNAVRVRCGGHHTRIPVLAADPPQLPVSPPEPLCSISNDTFSALIRTGSYGFPAVADSSVATAGAQLEVVGSEIRIVSSDHSRLASSSANWRSSGSGDTGDSPEPSRTRPDEKQAFGLNRKTLSQLGALAKSGDGAMRFAERDNHLFFEFGHRLLVCAKLADRLPDYEHVIPRDCPVQVRVNRKAMLSAVQAAMPFATGDFSRARLEIGSDALRIQVLSVRGEAAGSVEVLEAKGGPLTLHVNLVHIRDFAKAPESVEAWLEFDSPDTAFLLRPAEEDELVRHFCVGMPLASG